MNRPGRLPAWLVAAFAFAFAWLLPAFAHAAILPACELREQASVMPRTPLLFESTTEGQADAADVECEIAAEKVAGMCDERGASMLAPQRIRPVDGGTIDQCAPQDDIGPAADAHKGQRDTVDAQSSLAAVDATTATLGFATGYVLVEAYLPPEGGPLSGIDRGIDHPPR